MKINLSLTEMSQFFMKMAEAVKKKKLKPGASIPGCNSYFLCKFLKDTMLNARYVGVTRNGDKLHVKYDSTMMSEIITCSRNKLWFSCSNGRHASA